MDTAGPESTDSGARGELEIGDFVCGWFADVVSGVFDSALEAPLGFLAAAEDVAVASEPWWPCGTAGKRIPQKPETGSVNSNST